MTKMKKEQIFLFVHLSYIPVALLASLVTEFVIFNAVELFSGTGRDRALLDEQRKPVW